MSAGIGAPDAAGAGLSLWSDQTGTNRGKRGRFRLNRAVREATIAVWNLITGESHLLSLQQKEEVRYVDLEPPEIGISAVLGCWLYLWACRIPPFAASEAYISQLSDSKPQSYPNEPLDSIEMTSFAAIRACVAAPSCDSCP